MRWDGRPERSGHTRRQALVLAALALGAPVLARAQAGADSAARGFVESMSAEVLAILGATQPTDPARKAKLAALFARKFDVPQMAQFVLGRGWDAASAEERQRFVPLFERYVVSLYAERFAGYSGETVEVLGTRPAPGGQQAVATRILRPAGGAPIAVDYRLRPIDRGFRVVDVVVEGLSLLVTKRSEFGAVLSREGLPGLMQRLERQIAN